MILFFTVLGFWVLTLYGTKSLYRKWWRLYSLQPARYLREIQSVDYYRRLPASQFESLVIQGIRAHQFTTLGNPFLGRSKEQGYAWKKGKKTVLVYRPGHPLTLDEMDSIAKKSRAARAERAIVFSPFSNASNTHYPGLEILTGKKLLSWFSVLDVVPPLPSNATAVKCECGAQMKERISRAGIPLLVCSLYPDCRMVRQVTAPPSETLRFGAPRVVRVA